jgi:hypothetical protein
MEASHVRRPDGAATHPYPEPRSAVVRLDAARRQDEQDGTARTMRVPLRCRDQMVRMRNICLTEKLQKNKNARPTQARRSDRGSCVGTRRGGRWRPRTFVFRGGGYHPTPPSRRATAPAVRLIRGRRGRALAMRLRKKFPKIKTRNGKTDRLGQAAVAEGLALESVFPWDRRAPHSSARGAATTTPHPRSCCSTGPTSLVGTVANGSSEKFKQMVRVPWEKFQKKGGSHLQFSK